MDTCSIHDSLIHYFHNSIVRVDDFMSVWSMFVFNIILLQSYKTSASY